MNKEINFETFLSISPNKFGIYLLDVKTFKNLYIEEQEIKNDLKSLDINLLKDFLDDNIYKIEKYIGKFIKNIFIIVDDDNILSLDFGIKQKLFLNGSNKKYLKNALINAKDLFKESYQDQVIMHMLICKYIINDKTLSTFDESLVKDHLSLEIKIKSISAKITSEIQKLLDKYHISISQYIDENYIKDFFKNENMKLAEMGFKIQDGINKNEIKLIPKKTEKKGFFEKFFQLFG